MHPTRLTAALAALALTAGVAGTLAGTAAAADRATAHHLSPVRAGALEARLSPAQHKALISSAQQRTATTTRSLGLGAKEKLV
ncbi:M4 family metallopeptidase, partial [Streptomyces sp. NPDC004011]